MDKQIEDKLKKIQELINRGSTPGERKAAQIAFDNICEKYNIDKDKAGKKRLSFNLNNSEERFLFRYIHAYFVDKNGGYDSYGVSKKHVKREVVIMLDYDKSVILECAWAYFLPHYRKEKKKFLNKFYKEKSKAAKTWGELKAIKKCVSEYTDLFLKQYIVASNIYFPEDVSNDYKKISLSDYNLLKTIEGGKYHTQVGGGNLLNSGT
jgi:hypothetical protein